MPPPLLPVSSFSRPTRARLSSVATSYDAYVASIIANPPVAPTNGNDLAVQDGINIRQHCRYYVQLVKQQEDERSKLKAAQTAFVPQEEKLKEELATLRKAKEKELTAARAVLGKQVVASHKISKAVEATELLLILSMPHHGRDPKLRVPVLDHKKPHYRKQKPDLARLRDAPVSVRRIITALWFRYPCGWKRKGNRKRMVKYLKQQHVWNDLVTFFDGSEADALSYMAVGRHGSK